MDAEKFRKIIHKKYRECMEDCQIPTGALAVLNPAEFFGFYQWEENKSLRQDLITLSVAIKEINKSLSECTRAICICQECSDITKTYLPYTGVQRGMNEMERMKEACKREGCDKSMRCYGGGVNKDLFCAGATRRFVEMKEGKEE